MNAQEIIKKLNSLNNPVNVAGMARFGITPKTKVLGISLYVLRPMAEKIKKETTDCHKLALELWQKEVHEARLLAVFIDDPKKVTEEQMEKWIKDFDSWDICDQATTSLFDLTPQAFKKALEWSKRENEFEKRAGFALMAGLSVHDKKAEDKIFYPFLKAIKREATDERNYVRKAVNWALRNIGKLRNRNLYILAVETA
ncbi:MAG: DNA alkylation repair protein, partial [Candidatus Levybacteria bacterium RBG_16_35_6]